MTGIKRPDRRLWRWALGSRWFPKGQCQPPKVGFGSERAMCSVKDAHIRALAGSEPESGVSTRKGYIWLNRIMQHIESTQLGNILERRSDLSLCNWREPEALCCFSPHLLHATGQFRESWNQLIQLLRIKETELGCLKVGTLQGPEPTGSLPSVTTFQQQMKLWMVHYTFQNCFLVLMFQRAFITTLTWVQQLSFEPLQVSGTVLGTAETEITRTGALPLWSSVWRDSSFTTGATFQSRHLCIILLSGGTGRQKPKFPPNHFFGRPMKIFYNWEHSMKIFFLESFHL